MSKFKSYSVTLTPNTDAQYGEHFNNGKPINGIIRSVRFNGTANDMTCILIASALGISAARTIFTEANFNMSTNLVSFGLMQPAYTSGFDAAADPALVPVGLHNERLTFHVTNGSGNTAMCIILVEGNA